MPLRRDGHHHEDAGGEEDALEGVEEVGEGDGVPERLLLALRSNERPNQTHVQHVVQQQKGVNDGCKGTKNITKSRPACQIFLLGVGGRGVLMVSNSNLLHSASVHVKTIYGDF